ncbi:hypothetical protein D9M68_682690 [compost metagenome]
MFPFQQGQAFPLGGRQHVAIGALQQFGAQWQPRQGIHGIVEIEQQLGPLHGMEVLVLDQGQAGALEGLQGAIQPWCALDLQRTFRALVEMPGGDLRHIERHQADQHIVVRQPAGEQLGIMQAVLQGQHPGRCLEMRSHGFGGAGGIPGFHRDQHDFGVGHRRRITAEPDQFRLQPGLPAREVAEGQSLLRQRVRHMATPDEGYAGAADRQSAPHVAADAPGSENRDGWHGCPPSSVRPDGRSSLQGVTCGLQQPGQVFQRLLPGLR